MRLRLHLLLPALLAAAVAGCGSGDGGDSGTDPITGGEPDAGGAQGCDVELEVGTGNREFTPVVDGDVVYLFRGPQSGYMLYISVRARGVDPSNARLCYTTTVLTPEEKNVGEGCWNIQLPNDLGNGVHERVGVWGQVDPMYWSTPEQLRDEDVRVDVTLSDTRGCSAQGGFTAHISPDAPK